jgi:excinuclease ABC subunit A
LQDTSLVRAYLPDKGPYIELVGARMHNLQNVDLRIAEKRFNVVCGVSGAGKSTLVRAVLLPALRQSLGLVSERPGAFKSLRGHKGILRALSVDQAPIGRSPRSVPATFLGIWDEIRKVFAALPEAKVRGYSAGHFSFNGKTSGRCKECEGQGVIVSEMSFLPEVASTCASCNGLRFDDATGEIRYRKLGVGDALRLTVAEALPFFAAFPKITRPLKTLVELGLGYIQIGQGSHTLSGGEAQRLKLAAELTASARHEPTLYVLDEPTTGLHLSDVRRLVTMLDALVARGDTLVVIEHHPDIIRNADRVIELGKGGGPEGGRIVFEGNVTALLRAKTPTSRALAPAQGAKPKRG